MVTAKKTNAITKKKPCAAAQSSKDSKKSITKQPVRVVDTVFNVFTMQDYPVTLPWLEELAEKMVKWADDDDSLIFEDFLTEMGMHFESIKRWTQQCPALDVAKKYTLSRIASRREKGAMKHKYDTSMVARMMPHYSDSWKQIAEWNASLKESQDKPTNITIVMDNVEKTSTVPERNERRNSNKAGQIQAERVSKADS